MKRLTMLAFILFCAIGVVAQQTGTTSTGAATGTTPVAADDASLDDSLSDQVYREITVEDFENVEYTDKNIDIRVTKDQKAIAAIRDQYPAPIKNSKKYLGVKVHGRQGDIVNIIPPKELPISDFCQSISIWVYGKNFSGELVMLVRDAEGQIKHLSFGKLNFLGWRKLTAPITKDIPQEDKFLSQPRNLIIVKLQYKPGRTGQLREDDWDYFYLDDISAKVRKKYIDKQSDSW